MSLAKSARASAVMSKVKGGDPFAFTRRFLGYNEAKEGIDAFINKRLPNWNIEDD